MSNCTRCHYKDDGVLVFPCDDHGGFKPYATISTMDRYAKLQTASFIVLEMVQRWIRVLEGQGQATHDVYYECVSLAEMRKLLREGLGYVEPDK